MAQLKIKNIIFDLGNVVLNINPSLTTLAFEKLGYKNFNLASLNKEDKNFLDQFETGRISADDFRKHIRNRIGSDLSDEIIDHAWNALLLDLPAERLHLLKKLQTKYRLFLLSNTNELHLNHITKYLKETYRMSDLSDYFEKEYYSHRVGKRKPHPEIFYLLLNENKLISEETLFIDDSEEHILGAKGLNINTYHLKLPESILDIDVY